MSTINIGLISAEEKKRLIQSRLEDRAFQHQLIDVLAPEELDAVTLAVLTNDMVFIRTRQEPMPSESLMLSRNERLPVGKGVGQGHRAAMIPVNAAVEKAVYTFLEKDPNGWFNIAQITKATGVKRGSAYFSANNLVEKKLLRRKMDGASSLYQWAK